MNTKNLKYFLQTCKFGSINKAAESNYISSQGLGKVIKSIEEELKVILFYRNRGGMVITEYGEIVKKYATKILQDIDSMELELNDLKGKNKLELVVACSYGIISALSPNFFWEYRKANQDIKLNIIEEPDLLVENDVYTGAATIGFTIGPVDSTKFNSILIKTHELRLLINRLNALSTKEKIAIPDLNNEKIIIMNRNFKNFHSLTERCKEAGFDPNILLEASEINIVHKYAALNYGVGLTVDYVANELKNDNIVALPFEDKTLNWQIFLIYRKDCYLPHIAGDLINYVKVG